MSRFTLRGEESHSKYCLEQMAEYLKPSPRPWYMRTEGPWRYIGGRELINEVATSKRSRSHMKTADTFRRNGDLQPSTVNKNTDQVYNRQSYDIANYRSRSTRNKSRIRGSSTSNFSKNLKAQPLFSTSRAGRTTYGSLIEGRGLNLNNYIASGNTTFRKPTQSFVSSQTARHLDDIQYASKLADQLTATLKKAVSGSQRGMTTFGKGPVNKKGYNLRSTVDRSRLIESQLNRRSKFSKNSINYYSIPLKILQNDKVLIHIRNTDGKGERGSQTSP